MITKKCPKCETIKENKNFAKGASYCRLCQSNYMREWRKKNYKKAIEISCNWKKKNYKRAKQVTKEWHEINKGKRKGYLSSSYKKRRQYMLKYLYGLSPDDVENILKKQKFRCAICGTKEIQGRNLCIDHKHNTDKVRGILCHACNHGLGCFKDNPEFLLSSIEYLKS